MPNRMMATAKASDENQKIKKSVLSALRPQTIDAVWQAFQDRHPGSIETGQFADLAILSQNPLQAPAELLSVQVVKTIRYGKLAYARDDRLL